MAFNVWFQDQVTFEVMDNEEHIFSHAFADEGIYTCVVAASNVISDLFQQVFEFKVQYALENLYFKFADPAGYGILPVPSFSRDFSFILLSDKLQHLATNASWEIDYGNGNTLTSSSYITAADKELQYDSPERDHVYTWVLTYTEPGDFTASVRLFNDISEMTLDVVYRVYEEIDGLVFEDIEFLVIIPTLLSRTCLRLPV